MTPNIWEVLYVSCIWYISLFTQTWKRFSSKQRIISIHMRFAKRHCSEISQKVTIISYYVEMPYKKSTWFFSSHSKYCIITAAAALDLYVKSLGNCLEVWTDKWTGYFQARKQYRFPLAHLDSCTQTIGRRRGPALWAPGLMQ